MTSTTFDLSSENTSSVNAVSDSLVETEPAQEHAADIAADTSTDTATDDLANESKDDVAPELTIVEATEEAIADAAELRPDEVRAGKDKMVHIPTYAELKESEMYRPVVDTDSMTEEQLIRAAQNKLSRDMDINTFIYCWLHHFLRESPEVTKQFLIKSKNLKSGINYIERKMRERAKENNGIFGKIMGFENGCIALGESEVIELFLEYLSLDDAQIAAENAKAEAERKAKAAERAKAAKEKKTNKKSNTSAKGSNDSKKKESAGEKNKQPSVKKTSPKAPTSESVISLFDMLGA